MTSASITVATASIPPRVSSRLLEHAVESVRQQTLQPAGGMSVALDVNHQGSAVTRHRALMGVGTDWAAFLDDDDLLLPVHLERLYQHAMDTGADYVFSYYMVIDGYGQQRPDIDILGTFGKEFNPDDPHQTTIVTLVRTELAQQIGFKPFGGEHDPTNVTMGDDWQFTMDCVEAGAKIVHLPERTWLWRHHGIGEPGKSGNTSGLPTRW